MAEDQHVIRPRPPEALQPLQYLRGVRRRELAHSTDQRLVHRRDADESEDVPFQGLDAVGAEIPAIDERGHPHRHH